MSQEINAGKPLTGRMVFLIVASAFSIIIAVNFTMAYFAVSSFPGLETRNSYVSSQQFDSNRAAQQSLNWDVAVRYAKGQVILTIRDAADMPVNPEITSATLGRATHVRDDRTPDFHFDGQNFVADQTLKPGNWNLRLVATAADGTAYQTRLVMRVAAE